MKSYLSRKAGHADRRGSTRGLTRKFKPGLNRIIPREVRLPIKGVEGNAGCPGSSAERNVASEEKSLIITKRKDYVG